MNTNRRLDDYGDILTVHDVHDILGIGYNKAYELLKTKAIKNYKIGKSIRVPKKCLLEFLENVVQ